MTPQPNIKDIQNRFGDSPLLFELIPPVLEPDPEELELRRQKLNELFEKVPVDGINIPEIQEESKKHKKGNRRSEFQPRLDPREYALQLGERFKTEFVINRVVVQEPSNEQETWLLETFNDYGIQTVVLVGGESSDETYPGPSVSEGNRMVKEHLNQGLSFYGRRRFEPTEFLLGNIAISVRRRKNLDEPERMLQKIRSGADFFTTQIVAEAKTPVQLMEDLAVVLERENVKPPFLFWSFSPISEQKDIDFMRWLGISIPDHIEDRILNSGNPVKESIEWCQQIWDRLHRTQQKLPVDIPLGLNISFMGMRNFDNAIKLAEALHRVTSPT